MQYPIRGGSRGGQVNIIKKKIILYLLNINL